MPCDDLFWGARCGKSARRVLTGGRWGDLPSLPDPSRLPCRAVHTLIRCGPGVCADMSQLTTLAAAAALSVSVLSAAALPAAAQADAPCPMLSDAALSEAL